MCVRVSTPRLAGGLQLDSVKIDRRSIDLMHSPELASAVCGVPEALPSPIATLLIPQALRAPDRMQPRRARDAAAARPSDELLRVPFPSCWTRTLLLRPLCLSICCWQQARTRSQLTAACPGVLNRRMRQAAHPAHKLA